MEGSQKEISIGSSQVAEICKLKTTKKIAIESTVVSG
jgi:hypothetical protein